MKLMNDQTNKRTKAQENVPINEQMKRDVKKANGSIPGLVRRPFVGELLLLGPLEAPPFLTCAASPCIQDQSIHSINQCTPSV